MYKAYRIAIDDSFGEGLLKKYNGNFVQESVRPMNRMNRQRTFSAKDLWDVYFPAIKADVFISHSHKDVDLARAFARQLKDVFDLNVFIDSDVWNHSDDLQRKLDNTHCRDSKSNLYDYKKRNNSTAHTHMILSYALARMIDNTECFMFLQSNNSVINGRASKETHSPWIFYELVTTDVIKINIPKRLQKLAEESTTDFSEQEAYMTYPALGERLLDIDSDILDEWEEQNQQSYFPHALDTLYGITSDYE